MRLESLAMALAFCGFAAVGARGGTLAVTAPVAQPLSFGKVSVSGGAATSSVSVRNSGSTTRVIGLAPGVGCGEFTASALVAGMPASRVNPAILGDGQVLAIDVTYDPVDRVADTCTFTVLHDGNGATSFVLTGDGTAPQLRVNPSVITFPTGVRNGGPPQARDIIITNIGDEPIESGDLRVSIAREARFLLGAITGLPVAPGGTATVRVTLDPTSRDTGSDRVDISLDNDPPGDPDPSVILTGRGVPTPTSTATLTPTRTATATPTTTATGTPTPTLTPSQTQTPTLTATQTQTPTLTPTQTQTPTSTATLTATGTPTATTSPTVTPSVTPTASATSTPGLTLDIDDDGDALPLTDGLLVLRYLFGFRGNTLVAFAVGTGCGRCTPEAIEAYILSILSLLDVDGDGDVLPLTDGLLILRYLFGFRGAILVAGAVGQDCTLCTPGEIEDYIAGLL